MVKTSETPADADAGGTDSLRISRPPLTFAVLRGWEVTTVGQLHGLRAALRDEVIDCPRTDRDDGLDVVAQELVLVTSELVTNAIRHGRPPVLVRLLHDDARFLLTVADRGLSSAPRIAGTRPSGEGGFGLRIARHLAHDLAWYRTDTTTVIWAEIGP